MKITTKIDTPCCERCHALNGNPHPLFSFIVTLKPFHRVAAETKMLCQKCMVRAEVKALHRHYEHKATHTLLQIPQKVFRRFTANVRYFLFIGPLLFFTETILAQPPGLPDSPDQAPLGGLGLLAAAGGAYAWKKLKGTKAH